MLACVHLDVISDRIRWEHSDDAAGSEKPLTDDPIEQRLGVLKEFPSL